MFHGEVQYLPSKLVDYMAKQSGVHQIRGKYNDVSYYQQKGIRGGLLRRINQGMSLRLKEGAEYQLTRVANSFFGACSMYAAAFINMLPARAMYFYRYDRQAVLTKGIYNLVLEGQQHTNKTRVSIADSVIKQTPLVFAKVAKNDLHRFFPSISQTLDVQAEDTTFTLAISKNDLKNYCDHWGVSGAKITVLGTCYIGSINKSEDSGKFPAPYTYRPSRSQIRVWSSDEEDLEMECTVGAASTAFTFSIVMIEPIRTYVGGSPQTNVSGATFGIIQYNIE